MITPEQQRQLRDEGFCIFPEALGKDELERARAGPWRTATWPPRARH